MGNVLLAVFGAILMVAGIRAVVLELKSEPVVREQPTFIVVGAVLTAIGGIMVVSAFT